MRDYASYPEYDENRARECAQAFEEMLVTNRSGYLDIFQVDEIFHFYIEASDFRKAQQLIDFAFQSHPSSSDLHHKKAGLEFEMAHYENALTHINQALLLQPLQVEYLLFKSEILAHLDKYDDGIELLERALIYATDATEVYMQMGHIAQVCGRLEESEEFFRQVLAEKTDSEDALFELALILENRKRNGNYQEAIQLYNSFLDANPHSEFAWYNVGILYAKSQLFEEAYEAFDFATAIKDDFASAHFNKGRVLMYQEDYKSAVQSFMEVLSLEKNDKMTCYHIGECYDYLEMPKEALRYYLKAAELGSDMSDAYIGIGGCLEELEKFTEAIHYYEKALKIDPENTEILLSIAICEYKLGNLTGAYRYLEFAIHKNPNNLNIWKDWAILLYDNGNITGALTFLEEGIKVNTLSADLYYLSAVYYMDLGKKSRSLTMLENALLLDYKGHEEVLPLFPDYMANPNVQQLLKQYKKK
ncbi:MAG: tetratricopeptide repeat protein [Bacteroidia bacterium]